MALSNPPVAGCHFAHDYSAYPLGTQRLSGSSRAHHSGTRRALEKRASGKTLGACARIMANRRRGWESGPARVSGSSCAHHDGFSGRLEKRRRSFLGCLRAHHSDFPAPLEKRLRKFLWVVRARIIAGFRTRWKNGPIGAHAVNCPASWRGRGCGGVAGGRLACLRARLACGRAVIAKARGWWRGWRWCRCVGCWRAALALVAARGRALRWRLSSRPTSAGAASCGRWLLRSRGKRKGPKRGLVSCGCWWWLKVDLIACVPS